MSKKDFDIRDKIVSAMLAHVPEQGWTRACGLAACASLGVSDAQMDSLFPDGLSDIVAHFSDMMDRAMLRNIKDINPDDLRVRERIETAALARFTLMRPYKDAVRLALAYWSVPPRHLRASQVVWRTADVMWNWAGDESTDYNRYTKRGLLSGILSATTLVWLKDNHEDMPVTRTFLHHRIEHALQVGQFLGKFKRG